MHVFQQWKFIVVLHSSFVTYLGEKRMESQIKTLKVLNFWKFTSYCSLKPLWSGMGEVVSARTSPTLHPLPLCINCRD